MLDRTSLNLKVESKNVTSIPLLSYVSLLHFLLRLLHEPLAIKRMPKTERDLLTRSADYIR